MQLNSNDYFKSIFQTDLNCECLRCFLNGLFIDLDASEIIFLKKARKIVSRLASYPASCPGTLALCVSFHVPTRDDCDIIYYDHETDYAFWSQQIYLKITQCLSENHYMFTVESVWANEKKNRMQLASDSIHPPPTPTHTLTLFYSVTGFAHSGN